MKSNRIKSAFRTTGTHTGNFGKAKVQCGSRLNDLGVTDAENVRAVPPEEYYGRLQAALGVAQDAKLVRFLKAEILKYERQRGIGETRCQKPDRTAPPYRTPGC